MARIKLSGGWSGEVSVDRPDLPPPAAMRFPALETWKDWLHQLVTDPSALPAYQSLKHSATAEVCGARLPGADRINALGREVICKRSETGPLVGWALRLVGASRVRRNLTQSRRLLDAGIATARPLAWVRQNHARGAGWLISEHIPDLIDLDRLILTVLPYLDRSEQIRAKSKVMDVIVDALSKLKAARLHHRDLKASNIMIQGWDAKADSLRICIVDLDGLRKVRFASRHRQWQPAVRLAASLIPYQTITRTDYLRFLTRWLQRMPDVVGQPKDHYRRLSAMAHRYAERARPRRRHKLAGFTGD